MLILSTYVRSRFIPHETRAGKTFFELLRAERREKILSFDVSSSITRAHINHRNSTHKQAQITRNIHHVTRLDRGRLRFAEI